MLVFKNRNFGIILIPTSVSVRVLSKLCVRLINLPFSKFHNIHTAAVTQHTFSCCNRKTAILTLIVFARGRLLFFFNMHDCCHAICTWLLVVLYVVHTTNVSALFSSLNRKFKQRTWCQSIFAQSFQFQTSPKAKRKRITTKYIIILCT